ncbi:GNAT family N-acetyltransferase [Maribacter cobaltidurans]|uniref:GNAT family N-acetyltransferase n=1 Tax=Maribacter cobaltidurans TaxID=1178778 RepID=A0A223VA09_9FLAO|nr:GNAT family N-acetyltransferase [Maribacter cobaltidurans]ASV31980.1 GNAT family N-acetyltransferase [Maribacter cobaltidurans]GGD86202.1 N-acetyltransferase [Maribacter cobaltidurans]
MKQEELLRTDSGNAAFKELVQLLDADLALRDGEDTAFYSQFNGIAKLGHCIVYSLNGTALGCGAFKQFDDNSIEVKRMYVDPKMRGKGIASKILKALEAWARELGFTYCVLETGLRQPEAIALYKKNGYTVTANYPPYVGVDNSVCFRKKLDL